jgi:hypothetical protein
MVALDNTALLGKAGRGRLSINPGLLIGGIALGAALLVAGTILLNAFDQNGFLQASRLAWRYTALVFFAALVAAPAWRVAARFLPVPEAADDLSRKLIWGFCASYGIYLLSVFVPNVIRLSAGGMLMVLFGGGVALVMAATVTPFRLEGGIPLAAEHVRRMLLGLATAYFWLCYSVMALARISGPHRPDSWYDISLSLMIIGLLARYADRWFVHNDAVRTEVVIH